MRRTVRLLSEGAAAHQMLDLLPAVSIRRGQGVPRGTRGLRSSILLSLSDRLSSKLNRQH